MEDNTIQTGGMSKLKLLKSLKDKSSELTSKMNTIHSAVNKKMGDVKDSINSSGPTKEEMGETVSEGYKWIPKLLKIITVLFNDKEWEDQNLFVKSIVIIILICTFPAIPMFFLMGLLFKILWAIFYWTRAL
tara:strand:- start:194 stop:589 length:396 start_codon:yes stop_codon:yes gene_type:complete